MMYKDWISLGFTRIDLEDSVEVNLKGYGGYLLEKQLTPFMKIIVYWDKLDKAYLQTDIYENDECEISMSLNLDFATNLAKFY